MVFSLGKFRLVLRDFFFLLDYLDSWLDVRFQLLCEVVVCSCYEQ